MDNPQVGDLVSKIGGDYRFDGVIVAVFRKLSGVERIVVEDDRGTLFINKANNYVRRANATTPAGDGWIACSERMPAEHELVLVWRDGLSWPVTASFAGEYRSVLYGNMRALWSSGKPPTHWRPLPAPPTDGSEGK